ncbi:MAG: MFS transporter [Thermoplasmata archaeon]
MSNFKVSSLLANVANLRKNRTLLAISISELLRVMGRSGGWIFIPIYLITIRDVSFFTVGVLFFISSAFTIPTSIYGGNLIDRFGRKKMAVLLPPLLMIVYSTISASIYFNYSIFLIFAAFISIGPLSSIQGITDTVMVTDTTAEKDRINAYSLVRIAANIGFSIGPALGGLVVIFNYSYVTIIPAIGTIAELFLYVRFVNETLPPRKPENVKRRTISFPYEDKLFIIIGFLLAMSSFAVGPWEYILNQFFSRAYYFSSWQIGLLFAVNGLTVIIFQLPINTILKNVSEMNRISLGMIIYASSFFVIGITDNFYLLILDVIFLTFGENTISPAMSSIIGKIAPMDKRGEYFGGFSMINGVIGPFSPVFYEYLLSLFIRQFMLLWGIIAIICVIIAVTVFLLHELKYS